MQGYTYGVKQVVVVVVVISVEVWVPPLVVVSSRHPHHPLFTVSDTVPWAGPTTKEILTASCRSLSGCAFWLMRPSKSMMT